MSLVAYYSDNGLIEMISYSDRVSILAKCYYYLTDLSLRSTRESGGNTHRYIPAYSTARGLDVVTGLA